MRKIALDLNMCAWRTDRGELTLIGTWLLADEKKQPCMAIIRRGDENSAHIAPCVIPLERAWVWHETLGDKRQRTIAAIEFCERLRLGANPRNILHLMRAINNRIEDLIKMPPLPQSAFARGEELFEVGRERLDV